MLDIATKTKETTAAWAKQQIISETITSTIDKALILSTQLSDAQVVVDPLIEKINTMDPTSPQFIAVEATVAIHITQDL